jgi:predicted homoserine dehydrogenase-like protein
VAEVTLDRKPLLQPTHGFRTNVYAYAKRNLRAGERLDGIGGYTCYGLIENCADNDDNPGLPICLAEDIPVLRDIARDEKILMTDVRHDSARADFAMYRKALEAAEKGIAP